MQDNRKIGLELSYDQIYDVSEYSLQKLLNRQANVKTLEYLNSEKRRKTRHIVHKELSLQPYLKPGKMSNMQRKFIFKFRSMMLDVKVNFPRTQSNLKCEVCGEHEDDQQSILVCEKLNETSSGVINPPKYEDLFSSNVEKTNDNICNYKKKI